MFVNMKVRDGQKIIIQGVNRGAGKVIPIPLTRAVHLMDAGLVDAADAMINIKTHVDLCLKQGKGGKPPEIAKAGTVCKVPGNQAVKLMANGKAESYLASLNFKPVSEPVESSEITKAPEPVRPRRGR